MVRFMSEFRARLQMGDVRIELSGDEAVVERQLNVFKRLMFPAAIEKEEARTQKSAAPPQPPKIAYERILRVSSSSCSLSTETDLADAVLLILLAHGRFRQNNNVSGLQIMEGLRDSGIRVPRIDGL